MHKLSSRLLTVIALVTAACPLSYRAQKKLKTAKLRRLPQVKPMTGKLFSQKLIQTGVAAPDPTMLFRGLSVFFRIKGILVPIALFS